MTYGVDAAMDAMQTAATRALGYRAFRQSQLDELRRRDDPMLPAGNAPHFPID